MSFNLHNLASSREPTRVVAGVIFSAITQLPDEIRLFIHEGAGVMLEVYRESISVPNWGTGDNVIVPFAISMGGAPPQGTEFA